MGIQIGEVRAAAVPAVAFVLLWSSGFVGAKWIGAQAPVPTVLMWRFLPIAVVAAPIVWRFARHRGRTAFGPVALVGLLSQTGYLATVYWAIDLGVNTGTTALIDGVQPLVAAALVGPLLGIVVTRRQWAGLVLGLAGVALVTLSDALHAAGVPWYAYPVPLAGMLALVTATVLQRRIAEPPSAATSLAVHCTVSALTFTVAAVATGTAAPPSAPGFWLGTAWLILFATFGGYGLYWYLLARHDITWVNSLMFLVAPVTAVWGALAFGESFTLATATGLVIGTLAVLVVSGSPRPRVGAPAGEVRSPGSAATATAPSRRAGSRRRRRWRRGGCSPPR
ncbi:DMT family transporter [Nocardia sp. NPDC057353]|uniref:DMT family transporter n=1 Tax=Nocardia sp. NPDC057353 TaxID=3346104 RepID=UPI0036253CB8